MRRIAILALVLGGLLLAPLAASGQIPVSGRIDLSNGDPAESVEVTLLPHLDFYDFGLVVLAGQLLPDPIAVARTANDGTFRLLAPGSGLYQVRVGPDGYRPMGFQLLPLLEERSLPVLVLTPERPVRIKLKGPDGLTPPGARVVAKAPPEAQRQRRDRNAWQPSRRRAFADESGVARLGRGQDEALHLFAFAPGHLETERADVQTDSVTLRLTPASPRALRVVTASGQPAASALVRTGERYWRLGLTDDQGLFELPTPESGEILVHAMGVDGRRAEERADVASWPAEGPRLLTLEEPTLWRGGVVDHGTRQPIPGAFVWRSGQPAENVFSDSAGGYSLPGPEEGSMWIWAAAEGYLKDAKLSELTNEEGRNFSLERAVRTSGLIVDDADRPLADVDVRAEVNYTAGGGASAWRASLQLDRTFTDLQGRFSLRSLFPEVGYVVRASKPGFAPGYLSLSNARSDTTEPLRIVLERGRVATGSVVDESGVPVAGALVELGETPASHSPRAMFAQSQQDAPRIEALSDRQGRFQVADLPAGSFELKVSAPGYAPTLVSPVEVVESQPVTSIGELTLKPGLAIEGRVVDSRGTPIEGASVYATDPVDQMQFEGLRTTSSSEPVTSTDANGVFRVLDRREGERVEVMVRAPGFAEGDLPGVKVPTSEPVVLRLHRVSRVSGVVVDEGGRGVAGANLHIRGLRRFSSLSSTGRGGMAVTEEDGSFAVEEVAPGEIHLQVRAEGYQEAEISHLAVEPEQDLERVRVTLRRGALITGRVTDPSGRPLAEASVMIRDGGGRLGGSFSGGASDGEGRYRLEGVEPGVRSIMVRHEEYPMFTHQIEVQLGENRLDLSFEGGATVSGRVLTESGEAVANASISLQSPSANRWGGHERLSDSTGAFEFKGLSAGRYTVRVRKEGFAPASLDDVDVGSGDLHGLELRLEVGSTIVGRLRGLDSGELSTVRVYATSGHGDTATARAQTDGSYRLKDLPPGTYEVVATFGGRSAHGQTVIATTTEEVVLDLEFEEGLTLSGQAFRNSEPLAGVQVTVSGLDVSSHSSGLTDLEGRFRLQGLEPGRHALRVSNYHTGLKHHEEVELTSDREVIVRITSSRVSGLVVDAADSTPIAEALVNLQPTGSAAGLGDAMRATQSTDSAGHFRFAEASTGEYRLVASKDGYAPAESDLTVAEGLDQENLRIPMTTTEGVLVIVTLPSGNPAVEFWAATLDASGTPLTVGSHLADESGSARLSIPPGSWELWIGSFTSAVGSVQVEVPGGPFAVRLSEAAQFKLRVPDLEGDPTLATVKLIGADGRKHPGFQWIWSRSDPQVTEGRSEMIGLPPGTFTVIVEAADGRVWQTQVTLVSGENPEVVLP